MTEHPPCRNCGKPVQQRAGELPSNYRKRKSCGDPVCVSAVRSGAQRPQTHEQAVTYADPDRPMDFSAQNINAPDRWLYLGLTRPDTRTYGGVSM